MFVRIFIILGLCLDVVAIWFTTTKFRVLENVPLIHWTKFAAAIFLTILSFSIGFVSEAFELFAPSVYEGFFEQLMHSIELGLIACSLAIIMYMWLRVRET